MVEESKITPSDAETQRNRESGSFDRDELRKALEETTAYFRRQAAAANAKLRYSQSYEHGQADTFAAAADRVQAILDSPGWA